MVSHQVKLLLEEYSKIVLSEGLLEVMAFLKIIPN